MGAGVKQTLGCVFDDRVGADRDGVETVRAVGRGGGRRDGRTRIVDQVDVDAGQRNVVAVEVPVAIFARGGDVHATGDRTGRVFAEVVFDAVVAAAEPDRCDDVAGVVGDADGHAVHRSGRIESVRVTGGLDRFDDAVCPRRQVRELVATGRIGRHRQRGGGCDGVDREQPDVDARDARFAGVPDAVLVEVFVDVAGHRRRTAFRKVELDRRRVAVGDCNVGQDVGGLDPAAGDALDRPGDGTDAEVPDRLTLDDAVNPRGQPE